MFDFSKYFPITDPTLIFFVVLSIILLAPIIMGKLRIPHIIGMILAGVFVGPHGFNILAKDSSFELFGHVGLLYIMMLAGLEMNMNDFRNNRSKTITHGLLAFVVPMVLGMALNLSVLEYGVMTSVLLASMYASHTLIAYPIVLRFGLSQQRSVTVSVGATALTDTLTLLVLAVIGGAFKGDADGVFWTLMLVKAVAVFAIIFYTFPRIARYYFRRHADGISQFIFVLAMTFFAAGLMEFVGLEGLLGAFMAGLVLNRYVPNVSPLMSRLEFVGNAIFIPYFLIGVGMLVNVGLLFHGFGTIKVAAVMVAVALVSKWVAALGTQKLFGMSAIERELIYGLSNAQAGATLAAVLVGYNIILPDGQRLLNDDVLNGTVILILVTCLVSSLWTERAARELVLNQCRHCDDSSSGDDEKIIIPIRNEETAERLINLGLLVRNEKLNRGMVALTIVYDDINRHYYQERGRRIMDKALHVANASGVGLQTQVRIATNVTNGIKHAFKEFNASEMIIGVYAPDNRLTRSWGDMGTQLYHGLSRQIMMVRCAVPLNTLRRIVVAVPSRAEFEPGFYRWLERLARLSSNLECGIEFHGRAQTLRLISDYIAGKHQGVRAAYVDMPHWDMFPELASEIADDYLFVVVTARKGTVSYKRGLEKLPEEIEKYFSGQNIMIVFPDQHGEAVDMVTYTEPQLIEERSAWDSLLSWIEAKKDGVRRRVGRDRRASATQTTDKK